MSLSPRLAADAARQRGPFTTAQAIRAGYDHREIQRLVRRQVWIRLRRGVFVEAIAQPADPLALHVLRVRALLLRLAPPAVPSHVSASAMHGFELLDPDLSLLHVTRPALHSSRTEAGVHHHDASLPAMHTAEAAGLEVTSAARTVVDFARESSYEQGLVLAESVLRQRVSTKAELLDVLSYCLDWRGARMAGRVVSFASPLSESVGETLARAAFQHVGLPDPEQQIEIFDARGLVGRVDFLWREHGTIGESDGCIKYKGPDAEMVLYAEKRREDRLRALGFEVVRFGFTDCLYARAELGRKVRAAFDRRAVRGLPRASGV